MTEFELIKDAPDADLMAQDLRALADLVQNDAFVAAIVAQLFTRSLWPAHAVSYEHDGQEREVMAEAIRRFKAIATGPIRKGYRDDGAGYFDATVPLRALEIKLTDLRAQVCDRRVTGVETITEEIPDPEYIAAAPKVTITRKVEQVEWKCAPIMDAGEERCPKCLGMNGNHGLIHVRNDAGGGGSNLPCPNSMAAVQP